MDEDEVDEEYSHDEYHLLLPVGSIGSSLMSSLDQMRLTVRLILCNSNAPSSMVPKRSVTFTWVDWCSWVRRNTSPSIEQSSAQPKHMLA